MKLAFLLSRISDNKWFAPIIHEALLRNIEVELWLNYTDITNTTKWYEKPMVERLPEYGPNRSPSFKIFHNSAELNQLVHSSDAKFLFANQPPQVSKPLGQRWLHIVCSLYDSICSNSASDLDKFDAIFFATDHWIDMAFLFLQITKQIEVDSILEQSIRKKCFATGSPQFDHHLFCDRQKIRRELGLADNARVVLLMSFEPPATFFNTKIFREPRLWKRLWSVLILPFSYPYIFSKIGKAKIFHLLFKSIWERPFFFVQAFTSKSEKDVLLALKKFCKNNDAQLVLKARRKKDLAPYERNIADILVDEDKDYFPFTTAKLIVAADLVVTLYSTAAIESIASGTAVLNIKTPKQQYFIRDHHLLQRRYLSRERALADEKIMYNDNEFGLFNYPGVIQSLYINSFVENLPNYSWNFWNNDSGAREKYLRKYIKSEKMPASKQVLDILTEKFRD